MSRRIDSGCLSIPSDDLTVGDAMKGQIARSKVLENLKKTQFEQRKAFERQKFIGKFSSRLVSRRFKSRMNRKIKTGNDKVEVYRIRSKYLDANDLELLTGLREVSQQQHLQIKVCNIYRYNIDAISTWYVHPNKRPVVFRCVEDKDPNPKNYPIYNPKLDKTSGSLRSYGIVVYVSVNI
jgi:hypothetical protein